MSVPLWFFRLGLPGQIVRRMEVWDRMEVQSGKHRTWPCSCRKYYGRFGVTIGCWVHLDFQMLQFQQVYAEIPMEDPRSCEMCSPWPDLCHFAMRTGQTNQDLVTLLKNCLLVGKKQVSIRIIIHFWDGIQTYIKPPTSLGHASKLVRCFNMLKNCTIHPQHQCLAASPGGIKHGNGMPCF